MCGVLLPILWFYLCFENESRFSLNLKYSLIRIGCLENSSAGKYMTRGGLKGWTAGLQPW